MRDLRGGLWNPSSRHRRGHKQTSPAELRKLEVQPSTRPIDPKRKKAKGRNQRKRC